MFVFFFVQTWHQSICGAGSFAGCHVAVWFSVAITRRFGLHICNPELHSGTKLCKAVYFYNYSIIALTRFLWSDKFTGILHFRFSLPEK